MKTGLWTLGSTCSLFCFFALLIFFAPPLQAQKKKPAPKTPPRVTMVIPLGSAPGTKVKFTIRGQKLGSAKSIRFTNSKVTAKIQSAGSAPVPDKNPEKVGDTQVVAEVALPKDLPSGPLNFVVVTPDGESKEHALLIETKLPLIKEKEPNDGFNQAQPIKVSQIIEGRIDRQRDVDVFRIEGKAGQRLSVEVLAARHGSALDSILTLYDAAGQEIAANDDIPGSADSRLEVVLPNTGTFYLSLMDAHDTGGPTHVFWLLVK